DSWSGVLIFIPAMLLVGAAWYLATPVTLRHARRVQKIGAVFTRPFEAVTERWDPRSELTEDDVSPWFWINGTLPDSQEYEDLLAGSFWDYRLRVDGLVENLREFSCAELKAMPKQEQITTHFCIQGWSGV